jgi:hypothetical protein
VAEELEVEGEGESSMGRVSIPFRQSTTCCPSLSPPSLPYSHSQ